MSNHIVPQKATHPSTQLALNPAPTKPMLDNSLTVKLELERADNRQLRDYVAWLEEQLDLAHPGMRR